jgi:GDPmannose 4,6-dehydratase
MKENILITGITGQDGLFITKKFLNDYKNYKIIGTSRAKDDNVLKKLNHLNLNISENLEIIELDLMNNNVVREAIKNFNPKIVINLSGPSSVYDSFKDPEQTITSINKIYDNLFQSILETNEEAHFFQALSSEMFSSDNFEPLSEESKFEPRSPYAKAKYETYIKTLENRKKYGMNISCGILFNHESEFRDDKYLIMKIINTAMNINDGFEDKLSIGSMDLVRDWSFAGDVADAIINITIDNNPEDYVIGSGIGHSINQMVSQIFSYFDLDYTKYTIIDNSLLRKGDPEVIISNPNKIRTKLGWKNKVSFEELVNRCIKFKLSLRK